jgi:D-alanine-D-alanine ligase
MNDSPMVILYNEPVPGSGADDWDVLDEVLLVEQALRELGIHCQKTGIHFAFMQQISDLASRGIRKVFNLVEAIQNKGELNYFIPALLNLHGIAYSGNSLEALFITTSKRLTSHLLSQNRIVVPAFYKPSEWQILLPGKKYILKPVREEGSAGINAESVFTFDGQFPDKISHSEDYYWHLEEFIEGREFNVSILYGENGPEVLPLAEILFRDYEPGRPKIVDYHAKWSPGSFEYENTIRVFPDMSGQPLLSAQIRKAALDTWNCLGLKGYARVDLRVNDQDQVFVLEANANPCISPDGGFIAAAEKAGYSHAEVIRRIINDMNNTSHYGNL